MINREALFEQIASKAGIRNEALGDAWTLSGYTPDADEPEEARAQRAGQHAQGEAGIFVLRRAGVGGTHRPQAQAEGAAEARPRVRPRRQPAGRPRCSAPTSPRAMLRMS